MLGKTKEENYFDMFIGGIEFTCKVAEETLKLIRDYDYDQVQEKVQYIHTIEHAGDGQFHRLYQQLMKSFVTPIEREDILDIAQKIDDITDLVEDVANRFVMFDIDKVREDAVPFMEKIVKCCDVTKTAITEFKYFAKSKTLHEKIMEINDLEEDGDRLYMTAVRNLFVTSKDPVEIVKWREIYHKMELCFDACEDLADTMEGVIIKNT